MLHAYLLLDYRSVEIIMALLCSWLLQAGLQPNDDITIHYETTPQLCKVIEQFNDLIYTAVKQPLKQGPPSASDKIIISKDNSVS